MSEDTSISGTEHDRLRVDLAGYVLGGLTLAEQQAIEAHVAECADCRAELAELEPLPVLLELGGRAVETPASDRAAETDPTTPTDETGEIGEIGETDAEVVPISTVRSTTRTVGRRRLVGGAAAALAVAAALLIGVVIGRPTEPSFSAPIALQATPAVSGSSPSGTAALRATEAGTAVRLDLKGLSTAEGTYFECEWSSGQGTQSAGTFRAGADGSAEVELLTAARRYPGWSLVIVEHSAGQADGTPVLHAEA